MSEPDWRFQSLASHVAVVLPSDVTELSTDVAARPLELLLARIRRQTVGLETWPSDDPAQGLLRRSLLSDVSLAVAMFRASLVAAQRSAQRVDEALAEARPVAGNPAKLTGR